MSSLRAGVVSAVEVQGPLANNGSGSNALLDPAAASTWAVILFLAATVILFFII